MSDPPEPSLDLLLEDWRGAHRRARAYLRALGAAEAECDALARRAVERAVRERHAGAAARGAFAETLDALRGLLLGRADGAPPAPDEAERFQRWRLAAGWIGGVPGPQGASADVPPAMPPIARCSMVPERVGGRRVGERRRHARGPLRPGTPTRAPATWRRAARWRRALLLALVLVPSAAAGSFMLQVLPHRSGRTLEPLIAVMFGALFGWIAVGFWTAVFGFFVLSRGGDRFAKALADDPTAPLDPGVRTAVVMPICNEPVARVFAGLRATWKSLVETGHADAFDFFVLSDSTDPELWLAEERAWAMWLRESGAKGRIFYRRRRVRRKRKSGNIADFCRRWGRLYRYLIVLDADSVMSGDTLASLVRRMEGNRRLGMLQTAPLVVRPSSFFGRVTQFASRLYGRLFAAGMHFWQLGDAPYWGHNAILRLAPFIAHCGLPRLSGKPPLGGDLMSHDFVEAALLGRAGWSTWIAFDLPGSFEESPQSLLGELERDRRWCQGNLQHLRLLRTEGITSAHRALFLNGIFAYVSGLLWLSFLITTTGEAILRALLPPDYFPAGRSLHPEWPVWRPDWALALLGATLMLLFLPKILGIALALGRREERRRYGGVFRLLWSALLELLTSAFFAPVRMLFYCRFVLASLVGRAVSWRTGDGDNEETSWGEALRQHGAATVVAIAWAGVMLVLDPDAFRWLAPVVVALVVAIPLSVGASRARFGAWARRRGWLATPEEVDPPRALAVLDKELARAEVRGVASARPGEAFRRAVVDPLENALHVALLRGRRLLTPEIAALRSSLVERALAGGPDALGPREQAVLLRDPERLGALHRAVWELSDPAPAARWGVEPARASA